MAPYGGSHPAIDKLMGFFRQEGLYTISHWWSVMCNPPLCITEDQLREGFEIIDRGLEITDDAWRAGRCVGLEEPPLTTTTGEPPSSCTDGALDDGEECDDGNDLPNDLCNNHCRNTFITGFTAEDPMPGCTGLLAAPLDPNDDLIDLALIRGGTTPELQILQNDDNGGFVDLGNIFHTYVSTDVVFARPIDGDEAPDVIAMANNITLCASDGTGFCSEGKEIPVPEPQQTALEYVPRLLAVGDIVPGEPMKPGLDAVVIVKSVDTQENMLGVIPGGGDGTFGLIKPSVFGDDNISLGQVLDLALGEVVSPGETPDLVLSHSRNGNHYVSVFFNFAGNALNQTGPFKFNGPVSSFAITNLGVGDEHGDIIVAMPEINEIRFIGDADKDGFGIQPDILAIGPSETKVLAAPLRGDGTRDIVTFEANGADIRVATVLGGKLPTESFPHDTGLSGLTDFVVADLDGDGDGDIAVVNSACSVRVLINQALVDEP
jgi:cysteine-rich repeat protein